MIFVHPLAVELPKEEYKRIFLSTADLNRLIKIRPQKSQKYLVKTLGSAYITA